MSKAISNRQLYPAVAGGVLIALTCGVVLKLIHTSYQEEPESIPQTATSSLPQPQTEEPLSTPFESGPFLQASPSFQLANPALLQSTSPSARADTVVAGRSDPFAPIVRPSALLSRPRPPQAVAPPAPPQGTPIQNLPVVPVSATQSLPPLPALPDPAVPGSSMPQASSEVAVAPMAAPGAQNPVDRVAITGVAQIGNAVSVIVREAGSASSRHVKPGDMLAGGQVRVKAIDTSTAEPTVVLTYNGQDYTRTVGSSALIGSL